MLIFLYVLACIIGLFILILSIPVKVSVGYDDKIRLSVKYLFLKINILPSGKKEPKKESNKKEDKPKEEKPVKNKDKEKKPNPIVEMLKANGHDGMMVIIRNLGHILSLYGGKLFKSIVFDEIVLHIIVGTGDSASTAIKYGQICQKVYPVFGFICSNNLVRRYDIDVQPDFLANKTESEFYFDLSICIRKIINATIAMVVRLIFGVVIKFIKGDKSNKSKNPSDNINKETIQKQ